MAIGNLKTEADLDRFIRSRPSQSPASIPYQTHTEVAADLDAPSSGCLVYCIGDNGAGKRELRARFATGAVQVLATEP